MRLNLTAMIDVVFQLLVYFVVTVSFAVDEGVLSAQVPQHTGESTRTAAQAAVPGVPAVAPLRIVLTAAEETAEGDLAEGNLPGAGPPGAGAGCRIRVGDAGREVADFGELAEVLKQMQWNPQGGTTGLYRVEDPVEVAAQGQVRWQDVVSALNAVVKAGFRDVRFNESAEEDSRN